MITNLFLSLLPLSLKNVVEKKQYNLYKGQGFLFQDNIIVYDLLIHIYYLRSDVFTVICVIRVGVLKIIM